MDGPDRKLVCLSSSTFQASQHPIIELKGDAQVLSASHSSLVNINDIILYFSSVFRHGCCERNKEPILHNNQ